MANKLESTMTAPNDKKYEQQLSESNPTLEQQKIENKMEDQASTSATGHDNVHEDSVQQNREVENQIDVPAHSENNDGAEQRPQAPQQASNNSYDPLREELHYLVDAINCVIRTDGLNYNSVQFIDFPVSDEIIAEIYGWTVEAQDLIEDSMDEWEGR